MGESITQGMLAKWHVASGAYVKVDEVVASIETDKVLYVVYGHEQLWNEWDNDDTSCYDADERWREIFYGVSS
jgi:hypothetical protein